MRQEENYKEELVIKWDCTLSALKYFSNIIVIACKKSICELQFRALLKSYKSLKILQGVEMIKIYLKSFKEIISNFFES